MNCIAKTTTTQPSGCQPRGNLHAQPRDRSLSHTTATKQANLIKQPAEYITTPQLQINQTNSETPSWSTPSVTSPRHGLGQAAFERETGTTSPYHRPLRRRNPPWQTRIKPRNGATSHIYTNGCGGNTHSNKI